MRSVHISCVSSDSLDMGSVHTSYTKISSDTSSRQQTDVVLVNEKMQNGDKQEESDRPLIIKGRETVLYGKDIFCTLSSGKNSKTQEVNFPELFREAAQVVGQASDKQLPGEEGDRSVSRVDERGDRLYKLY